MKGFSIEFVGHKEIWIERFHKRTLDLDFDVVDKMFRKVWQNCCWFFFLKQFTEIRVDTSIWAFNRLSVKIQSGSFGISAEGKPTQKHFFSLEVIFQ